MHYFACNDAEGWCLPLTQRYRVHFERDRHGGSVFSRDMTRRMRERGDRNRRREGRQPRDAGAARPAGTGTGAALGTWAMVTEFGEQTIEATLVLDRDDDGRVVGTWTSRGRDFELENVTVDGKTISFTRPMGGMSIDFKGHGRPAIRSRAPTRRRRVHSHAMASASSTRLRPALTEERIA